MAKRAAKKTEERVMIVLPRPENVTGDKDTVVGINGKLYQIQYDKPVEVPKEVAEVIQNTLAMEGKIKQVEDTITGKEFARL